MGRHSKYTPAMAQAIGERLGKGEPLAVICRDRKIAVEPDTVRNWMAKDPEFARLIARAREAGEDAIAHNVREVARGRGDSSGDVQRDKLIIDTDLKLLAKFNPKRWGDRIQHADADGNSLPPVQFILQPVASKPE